MESVVGYSVVGISSSMEVTVFAVTLSSVSSGPIVDVTIFETVELINEPVDDETHDADADWVKLLPDTAAVVFLM